MNKQTSQITGNDGMFGNAGKTGAGGHDLDQPLTDSQRLDYGQTFSAQQNKNKQHFHDIYSPNRIAKLIK